MTTKIPLRIAHPFPQIPYPTRAKVQASISTACDTYLFKRLLLEGGQMSALIATFLVKFHDECVRRGVGLPPGVTDTTQARWDEDNESAVAQILLDMNFNPKKEKKTK